jgi:hypothetical protein
MISWLLARLELNPYAVFLEKELTERFPEEFQQARWERLVRRVAGPPGPGAVGGYPHPSGKTYVVVPLPEGGYEAFDDEDVEADPVMLTAVDLVRWTLDLPVVCRKFQEMNGLTGNPECLDACLWFLGEKESEEKGVAHLLGFLSGIPSVEVLLTSLTVRLPTRYRRFVVVCPTYTPSLDQIQQLEPVGVTFLRLSTQNSFRFPKDDGLEQVLVRPELNAAFQHSEDYRWIKRREQEFNLSPSQAEVLGILHRAQEAGAPGLTWDAIKRRLSSNADRMSDIFRKQDRRSQLISYQRRGNLYSLKY